MDDLSIYVYIGLPFSETCDFRDLWDFLVFLVQSLYHLNRDLRTQETEQKDRQTELRQQQEEIKEKSREAIAIRETLTKGEATFHYNILLSYFIVCCSLYIHMYQCLVLGL